MSLALCKSTSSTHSQGLTCDIDYKSDLFTSKSTHTILWLMVSADDDDDDVDKEADISAKFCSRMFENKTLAV